MDKLEQLRAKPDHIKRMIAAGVAGGITLVIIVFWIVSLSVSSGSSAMADNASAQIAASPFSTLSASVEDAFVPVGAAFERMMGYFSGTQATSSNAIQMYSPAEAQAAASQNQSAQMNTVNQ